MILKRGVKLGQGVGALKKGGGGLEPPYELCLLIIHYLDYLVILLIRLMKENTW